MRSKRYPSLSPQGGGAESSADDLGLGRGVVLSRAAASLRSVETQPYDRQICPRKTGTSAPRKLEAFLPSLFIVGNAPALPEFEKILQVPELAISHSLFIVGKLFIVGILVPRLKKCTSARISYFPGPGLRLGHTGPHCQ